MFHRLSHRFWLLDRSRTSGSQFLQFFFFKQKTAYEIFALLEFRRVLFRSLNSCSLSRIRIHGSAQGRSPEAVVSRDRKSTRLNSSHANISYAVFCLKKT